ncbi:angiopoietin-related protein 7-like [Anopheles aquasalis]|uniref:angiopoietin-related protein 7-like n=1 Tax=Anopheles aquasalis TaxID=42839 RepID=UPI00215A49E9|nr:angiopoietin-related protein 7-like [Anopheles aquasalis]
MSLSFWYLFVAFVVGVIGEEPNSNTGRLGLPILESVSGFALERLLNKHDFLQHQLLEQSKSIAAVQSQQRQSFELLTKMLQDVQNQQKQDLAEASKWKTEILATIKTSQLTSTNLLATLQQQIQQQKNDTATDRAEFSKRYIKSQKDTEDIREKHDQSIKLLNSIKQEMQVQSDETAKDRISVSKWQADINTSIASIRNEMDTWKKDFLGVSTSERDDQVQSIKLLQKELEQQKNDTWTDRADFVKWQTKSQKDMEDIKEKHDESMKLLTSINQTVQSQGFDIRRYRGILSNGQTDINTSIRNIRNNMEKWQNDILKIFDSNREEQRQQFKLLQQQMEQQKNDTASDRTRYLNWYNESLKVIGSIQDKQDLNGKLISNLSQNLSQHFVAYCEQERHERGWMVLQHHFSATLDFDRNWTDYRNGFGEAGSAGADVWIGLERIHQITAAQPCELLVELMDFDGTYKFARYSQFAIGNETEQYRINALGVYKGSAGDALRNHSGVMFSTKDQKRDNDADDKSCAQQYSGGWWFKQCHFAFLNGKYNSESKTGIHWFPFKNSWSGLSSSRMLVRPL